ncbi:MAG: ImmA/IrrE family metallo-endopeptidase [Lachnospiraceae bacterium]|nr:ImmA/IrrE family metallo-endopeptidase [Lachnospiraceae bacterium]
MDSCAIYRKANAIVRQAGTRDAEKIARELGIWIYDEPAFDRLLGMYTFRWNHRMIFLNPRMDPYLRQMVIAHELGHDALHQDIAKASKDGLKEFVLFQMKDSSEYEANAYGAHILLNNDDVYQLAMQGCDVVEMSQRLGSDINLMLIKLQEMNKLGYDFNIPYNPDSRFFRKIQAE